MKYAGHFQNVTTDDTNKYVGINSVRRNFLVLLTAEVLQQTCGVTNIIPQKK